MVTLTGKSCRVLIAQALLVKLFVCRGSTPVLRLLWPVGLAR
jgi:hypothetical protein